MMFGELCKDKMGNSNGKSAEQPDITIIRRNESYRRADGKNIQGWIDMAGKLPTIFIGQQMVQMPAHVIRRNPDGSLAEAPMGQFDFPIEATDLIDAFNGFDLAFKCAWDQEIAQREAEARKIRIHNALPELPSHRRTA
jgi:hypothetical protein